MSINIQPILDEARQALGNPTMDHPVLVKLYQTHGCDAVNAELTKHWREVDQGITTEYKQS